MQTHVNLNSKYTTVMFDQVSPAQKSARAVGVHQTKRRLLSQGQTQYPPFHSLE